MSDPISRISTAAVAMVFLHSPPLPSPSNRRARRMFRIPKELLAKSDVDFCPITRRTFMPRGDKSKYTDRQKRKAEHIEEGYETRGVSKKESGRRAWATVNREEG